MVPGRRRTKQTKRPTQYDSTPLISEIKVFMSAGTAQMIQEVLSLLSKLQSSDPEEVKAAMREYLRLVDRFYQENRDRMAPQQYTAAQVDVEYFLRLVELALAYEKKE